MGIESTIAYSLLWLFLFDDKSSLVLNVFILFSIKKVQNKWKIANGMTISDISNDLANFIKYCVMTQQLQYYFVAVVGCVCSFVLFLTDRAGTPITIIHTMLSDKSAKTLNLCYCSCVLLLLSKCIMPTTVHDHFV